MIPSKNIELPLRKEVCKAFTTEKIDELKSMITSHASSCLMDAFGYDKQEGFDEYIKNLGKTEFCEYLSKYYINSKCQSLTAEVYRQIL
jgi:hypothetical protein